MPPDPCRPSSSRRLCCCCFLRAPRASSCCRCPFCCPCSSRSRSCSPLACCCSRLTPAATLRALAGPRSLLLLDLRVHEVHPHVGEVDAQGPQPQHGAAPQPHVGGYGDVVEQGRVCRAGWVTEGGPVIACCTACTPTNLRFHRHQVANTSSRRYMQPAWRAPTLSRCRTALATPVPA